MSATGIIVTISPRDYEAVLFDMDGVLTRTATVHAAAWKRLFDEFLQARAAQTGEPFSPFDIDTDYRRHVDGKPRHEGVRDFLRARGIEVDEETLAQLAQRKDHYFLRELHEHGVEAFEGAVELVQALKAQDVRVGVVSSSINCALVLRAAGLSHLFETRVDGRDLLRLNLRGKPAPDAFLEAARRLNADPAHTVVIEDAIAGVQAARAGNFGYVIGVDHTGQSQALREAGAHEVVRRLTQIHVSTEPPSTWWLVYEGFDPAHEGIHESLCALGNGYFATRGAVPWAVADGVHYPGTYVAGCYNRLRTDIGNQIVENESLVNLPNWLLLQWRSEGEDWFDARRARLLSYRQDLNLRLGQLTRCFTFESAGGRRTTVRERRIVSMADMHLGALELSITAENWSGRLTMRSAIDGRVINDGARLYRPFNNQHLELMDGETQGPDGLLLPTRTCQSRIAIAVAARTRVLRDGQVLDIGRRTARESGYIAQEFDLELDEGATLVVEKMAFVYTSRDPAISECTLAACKALSRAVDYETALAAHTLKWRQLWRRFDIHLRPRGDGFRLNVPMLLRLHMFHLLQTGSLNSIGLDIGLPARGWTGEAYEGHVFWDEIFIFPTLNIRIPEIGRSLLMYRYRRLDEARAAARAAGYRGAMFPWQSGSDGQEETQQFNLNPRSGRWVRDNTYLQRHVNSAIVWNVWHYYQVTADMDFMQAYGAELILEIARFWSSIARFNQERRRYEIHGVMGPDEFHDAYPDATGPGLKNNAYTNLMAVWVLLRALDTLEMLPPMRRTELMAQLDLTEREISLWEDISRRMFIPFHDEGIISQFEGYERLQELDWQHYRDRYGNIQRLELILEAENDSANRYKVSKQADVLMLFYLFSSEELKALLERLGYRFDPEMIPRNVAYYDCRSTHGSTLSRVVHAWVLARSNRPRAMQYYAEALQSDVSDIQGGTTQEGVHLGAMAGTVDLAQRVATGIEVTGGVLRLNPRLPEGLERLDMRITYRGHTLDLRLTRDTLTVRGRAEGGAPVQLMYKDETFEFSGAQSRVFRIL